MRPQPSTPRTDARARRDATDDSATSNGIGCRCESHTEAGRAVTEQQPYEVVRRLPEFELRRYPSHLVAEVEVQSSFADAGNKAFRVLAAFISGRNRGREGGDDSPGAGEASTPMR